MVTSDDMDRESYPLYKLKVKVFDLGTPSLADEAFVEIHLSDVNDGVPMFSKGVYHINIAENTPAGSTMLVVHVEDRDLGGNAVVEFAIEEGYTNFKIQEFNTSIDVATGSNTVGHGKIACTCIAYLFNNI